MRISGWSSDVCSSDLQARREPVRIEAAPAPVTKSERARLETPIPLFAGAAAPGELPPLSLLDEAPEARESVLSGKSVSVRVDPGGRRISKKQRHITEQIPYEK